MNNYEKTNWIDHLVEFPDRYTITYNADGTVKLEPKEGEVYSDGTPINAINLNKLEEGVYQAVAGDILLGGFDNQSRTLVLRKGTEESLPILAEAELGYATDTKKLFIGSLAGNISVIPDIDITGAVEEIIDRRVNHIKSKTLAQILIDEAQTIKDYVIAQINTRINSVTGKPLNQVVAELINNRVNSDLAESLDKQLDTKFEQLKESLDLLKRDGLPVVKSVQFGTAMISTTTAVIDINNVEPNKCLIILGDSVSTTTSMGYSTHLILTDVTATSFSVTRRGSASQGAGWQVIEFC